MANIVIEGLPSNQLLYEYATAEDTPGSSAFAAYPSYEDFAAACGPLTTAEQRELFNAYTTTSMQFFLNEVEAEGAKNYLEEQGFGKKTTQLYGGFLQKIYVETIGANDPFYKNIQNGEGTSPFKVNKPTYKEFFYTFNDAYQAYTTVQETEMRTALADEYGMSMMIAGQMESFANHFVEWELNKELDTINEAINSEKWPLKDTQKVEVEMDSYSDDEIKSYFITVKNIIRAMTMKGTRAFNAGSWKRTQKTDDLVLLTRPLVDTVSEVNILPYAFHNENLGEGIKKIFTDNFGGLIPTVDGTLSTELKPVRDSEGHFLKQYSANGVSTDETKYDEDEVQWYDPNADILAIICDKDLFFEVDQEPYRVDAAPFNPANRSITYWASKNNVGFHYDPQMNMVVIKKKITPEPPTPTEPTIEINDNTSTTSYEISEIITSDIDVNGVVENFEAGDVIKASFAENSIWRIDGEREVETQIETEDGVFYVMGNLSVSEEPQETTTTNEVLTVSLIRNGEAVATDTITLQMTYTVEVQPDPEPTSTKKSTSKK